MNMLRPSEWLDVLTVVIEFVVSGTLVLIAAFLSIALVFDFVVFVGGSFKAGLGDSGTLEHLFGHDGVFVLLNHVLVVFIVIELFKIAVAYMNHEAVVGTVLEAGLIAVVRQFVLFEQGTVEKAISLGFLAVSVGLVWFLLYRSGVKGLDATHTTLAKALVHERRLIARESREIREQTQTKHAGASAENSAPEHAQ